MRPLTKVAQVQIPEATPYVRGLGLTKNYGKKIMGKRNNKNN